MPDLLDTQTHAHVQSAFAQDAQLCLLLQRYARVAELEGFSEAARTFRELAESVAFQAQGHLDLILPAGDPISAREVGDTTQNLRSVLAAHDGVLSDSLDDMAAAAHAEGFAAIGSWFTTLRHARRAHRARLVGVLGEEEMPVRPDGPVVAPGVGGVQP